MAAVRELAKRILRKKTLKKKNAHLNGVIAAAILLLLLLAAAPDLLAGEKEGKISAELARQLQGIDETAKIKTIIASDRPIQQATEIGPGLYAAELTAPEVKELTKKKSTEAIFFDKKISAFENRLSIQGIEGNGLNGTITRPTNLTGAGVRIAILDTGVDSERVIESMDFSVGPRTNPHGTQVALKILETAPDAMLIDAKVLDSDGTGQISDLIAALYWASGLNDTNVIVLALGAPDEYSETESPVNIAIRDATEKGTLVIAASGNCAGGCDGYFGVTAPGTSPDALTIGALDEQGRWAEYSSGDAVNGKIKPDITAPGENRGTSIAAANAAGAAAVLLEKTKVAPEQAKEIMKKTADDLGESGPDERYGQGALNLTRALKANLFVEPDLIRVWLLADETREVQITLTNWGAEGIEVLKPVQARLGPAGNISFETEIKHGVSGIEIETNAGNLTIPVEVYLPDTPAITNIQTIDQEIEITAEPEERITGVYAKADGAPLLMEKTGARTWLTRANLTEGEHLIEAMATGANRSTYTEKNVTITLDKEPPSLTSITINPFFNEQFVTLRLRDDHNITQINFTTDEKKEVLILSDAQNRTDLKNIMAGVQLDNTSTPFTLSACDSVGNCMQAGGMDLEKFAEGREVFREMFGGLTPPANASACYKAGSNLGSCIYETNRVGAVTGLFSSAFQGDDYTKGAYRSGVLCGYITTWCDATEVCEKVEFPNWSGGRCRPNGNGGSGGNSGPGNTPSTFTLEGVDTNGDGTIDAGASYAYEWNSQKPIVHIKVYDGDGISSVSVKEDGVLLPQDSKEQLRIPFCGLDYCPAPTQTTIVFTIAAIDAKGSSTTQEYRFNLSTKNAKQGLSASPKTTKGDKVNIYYFTPEKECGKNWQEIKITTPQKTRDTIYLDRKNDCLYAKEYALSETGTYRATAAGETQAVFYKLDLSARLDDAFRTPKIYKEKGEELSLVLRAEKTMMGVSLGAMAMECTGRTCTPAYIEPEAYLRKAPEGKILALNETKIAAQKTEVDTELGKGTAYKAENLPLESGDELVFKYKIGKDTRIIPLYFSPAAEVMRTDLLAQVIDDPSYIALTNRQKLLDYYFYHTKEGTYTKGDYYAKAALTILYENAYATRTVVKDVSGEQYPWNSYEEYEAYTSSLDWNKQKEINALAERIRPNCPTCQNIILLGNDYVVPQYRYSTEGIFQPTDKPYSGVSSLAQPIKEDYTTIYNIAPLGYNVTGISRFQTINGKNITTQQKNAEDLACSQLSELDGLVVLYGTPATNHLLKDCFSEEKVTYLSSLNLSYGNLTLTPILKDTILFEKGAYLPAGKTKTVLIALAQDAQTAKAAALTTQAAIRHEGLNNATENRGGLVAATEKGEEICADSCDEGMLDELWDSAIFNLGAGWIPGFDAATLVLVGTGAIHYTNLEIAMTGVFATCDVAQLGAAFTGPAAPIVAAAGTVCQQVTNNIGIAARPIVKRLGKLLDIIPIESYAKAIKNILETSLEKAGMPKINKETLIELIKNPIETIQKIFDAGGKAAQTAAETTTNGLNGLEKTIKITRNPETLKTIAENPELAETLDKTIPRTIAEKGEIKAKEITERLAKLEPKIQTQSIKYGEKAAKIREMTRNTLAETGSDEDSVEGLIKLMDQYPEEQGDAVIIALTKSKTWDDKTLKQAIDLDEKGNLKNYIYEPAVGIKYLDGLFNVDGNKYWVESSEVQNMLSKELTLIAKITDEAEQFKDYLPKTEQNAIIVIDLKKGATLTKEEIQEITENMYNGIGIKRKETGEPEITYVKDLEDKMQKIDYVLIYDRATNTVTKIVKEKP